MIEEEEKLFMKISDGIAKSNYTRVSKRQS